MEIRVKVKSKGEIERWLKENRNRFSALFPKRKKGRGSYYNRTISVKQSLAALDHYITEDAILFHKEWLVFPEPTELEKSQAEIIKQLQAIVKDLKAHINEIAKDCNKKIIELEDTIKARNETIDELKTNLEEVHEEKKARIIAEESRDKYESIYIKLGKQVDNEKKLHRQIERGVVNMVRQMGGEQ